MTTRCENAPARRQFKLEFLKALFFEPLRYVSDQRKQLTNQKFTKHKQTKNTQTNDFRAQVTGKWFFENLHWSLRLVLLRVGLQHKLPPASLHTVGTFAMYNTFVFPTAARHLWCLLDPSWAHALSSTANKTMLGQVQVRRPLALAIAAFFTALLRRLFSLRSVWPHVTPFVSEYVGMRKKQ